MAVRNTSKKISKIPLCTTRHRDRKPERPGGSRGFVLGQWFGCCAGQTQQRKRYFPRCWSHVELALSPETPPAHFAFRAVIIVRDSSSGAQSCGVALMKRSRIAAHSTTQADAGVARNQASKEAITFTSRRASERAQSGEGVRRDVHSLRVSTRVRVFARAAPSLRHHRGLLAASSRPPRGPCG